MKQPQQIKSFSPDVFQTRAGRALTLTQFLRQTRVTWFHDTPDFLFMRVCYLPAPPPQWRCKKKVPHRKLHKRNKYIYQVNMIYRRQIAVDEVDAWVNIQHRYVGILRMWLYDSMWRFWVPVIFWLTNFFLYFFLHISMFK